MPVCEPTTMYSDLTPPSNQLHITTMRRPLGYPRKITQISLLALIIFVDTCWALFVRVIQVIYNTRFMLRD